MRREQSQLQAHNAESRALLLAPSTSGNPESHPEWLRLAAPPQTEQRPSGFSSCRSKQLKEYRQEFRSLPGVRASMMEALLLFLSSLFFS